MCCENDHIGYWPREKQMKSYVLRGERGEEKRERKTVETKIYRIVDNQIVGEIPLSEIKAGGYYHHDDPDLGLAEASNYLIRESLSKRREVGSPASQRNTASSPHQLLSEQRDSLSSLIERARQEQRIPWQ